MISIFKAVKDNNVELIRDLIEKATSGTGPPPTLLKGDQGHRHVQRHSKAAGGTRQINLNKRSILGRTALHLAAARNRVEIVKLLVECPLVDVNLRDHENGWTALHRALYLGNIEIALMLMQRHDIDLNIKDYEGLKPLELYFTTVENTFPVVQVTVDDPVNGDDTMLETAADKPRKRQISGGTALYSWGSNANYVLGHRDSENRQFPERVPLEFESQRSKKIMTRPRVMIESVHMSKYHSAVVTTETTHNLLLCGFGQSGRLGTGKESDTQLTFRPVPWSERIIAVALGRDHTVAVTESRNVITFGSNEFGQLGYELEDSKEGAQLVPRKVQAQCLKKQAIIGAAASAVHSVVYTKTDIFTFGYNQGQLGYHSTADDLRQVIPRKVAFTAGITQVSATEYATAVLFDNHEVILLCNYTQQKIFFPVQRFPAYLRVHSSSVNYMVKLLPCNDNHMATLSNNGDVYVWSCKPSSSMRQADKTCPKSKATVTISSPKRVWTLRKPHLAATDASMGRQGELIVCTKSGQVFTGIPIGDSKDNNYKFSALPNLQRCIRVCANSSGAFMALRSEYQTGPVDLVKSTLRDDLANALPHAVIGKRLEHQINDLLREKEKQLKEVSNIASAEKDEEEDVEKVTATICEVFERRIEDAIQLAWKDIDAVAAKDKTLDIVFDLCEGKHLYCHSCLLACRSPTLRKLFLGGGHPDITMVEQNGVRRMRLNKEYDPSSMLLLLDYLYTDSYLHPMGAYFQLPCLSRGSSSASVDQIQKELVQLAKIFDLRELLASASSSFNNTPEPTITQDTLWLLESQKFWNVRLMLSDGELLCHEVVVRQRCPFFGALFEPNSVWTVERRRRHTAEACVPVDVSHIRKETMEILLRHFYGDFDDKSLFADIIKDSREEMMMLLLETLCVADELLLYNLKRICEASLVRFLDLKSARKLLEKSKLYLADCLKDACLKFIAANLDIFLNNGGLEDLDQSIIKELEETVRRSQAMDMPYIRQPGIPFESTTKSPDDEDLEFSCSLYTMSHEDQPVISNYAETLVTIMPSPVRSAEKSGDSEDGMIFSMDEDDVISPKESKTEEEKPAMTDLHEYGNTKPSTSPAGTSRQGWAIPLTAAGSAESKPSLRDILGEQLATPPGSSGQSGKLSAPVHIPKKLSQKERRKLHQQELAAAAAAASTSPKPVWGKVAPSHATPPEKPQLSWKDISPLSTSTGSSVEESSKGKKIYVSKEEIFESADDVRKLNAEQKPRELDFDPTISLGSNFALTPIRRQRSTVKSQSIPGHGGVRSFQDIQRQQELEDQWIKGKKTKKSLIRIQIEEKAIEALREFYVQTVDPSTGEWFEIESLN